MASLFSSPKRLQGVSFVLSIATAALGALLFATCWAWLTHGIFALLLIIVLLNTLKVKTTTAATTTRILLSVFWIWAVIIAVQALLVLLMDASTARIDDLQNGIVRFGGMLLCYLTPAAAAAMLYHDKRTTRYDRVMGLVTGTATVAVAIVATCTDITISWPIDNGLILPYVWLVATVFSALMLWISFFTPTDNQHAALEAARDRRLQKRTMRKK